MLLVQPTGDESRWKIERLSSAVDVLAVDSRDRVLTDN